MPADGHTRLVLRHEHHLELLGAHARDSRRELTYGQDELGNLRRSEDGWVVAIVALAKRGHASLAREALELVLLQREGRDLSHDGLLQLAREDFRLIDKPVRKCRTGFEEGKLV